MRIIALGTERNFVVYNGQNFHRSVGAVYRYYHVSLDQPHINAGVHCL